MAQPISGKELKRLLRNYNVVKNMICFPPLFLDRAGESGVLSFNAPENTSTPLPPLSVYQVGEDEFRIVPGFQVSPLGIVQATGAYGSKTDMHHATELTFNRKNPSETSFVLEKATWFIFTVHDWPNGSVRGTGSTDEIIPLGVIAKSIPARYSRKTNTNNGFGYFVDNDELYTVNPYNIVGGTSWSGWGEETHGIRFYDGGRYICEIARLDYIDNSWKITQYAQGGVSWQPQVNV